MERTTEITHEFLINFSLSVLALTQPHELKWSPVKKAFLSQS